MRRLLILLSVLPILALPLANSASAAGGCSGSAGLIAAEIVCKTDPVSIGLNDAGEYVPATDPCTDDFNRISCVRTRTCVVAAAATDGNLGLFGNSPIQDNCAVDPGEPATVEITTSQVLRAFRNLTWPAAELNIQPPGGETLVNFPTVYHATPQPTLTRTVTLLGQRVQIQAWPESYTWHHGDQTSQITDHPGVPVTEENDEREQVLATTINHTYAEKGSVQVSVDVTYAGQFRIGNGTWTPIGGTHTVTGTPQDLAILTARPVLVD